MGEEQVIMTTAIRGVLAWAIVGGTLDILLVALRIPSLFRQSTTDSSLFYRHLLVPCCSIVIAVAATWVCTPLFSAASLASSLALFALLIVLRRHRLCASDGADHMLRFAMAAWILGDIVALDGTIIPLAPKLMGGSYAVCYCIAGFAKLVVPGWRDGTTLATLATTAFWRFPKRDFSLHIFRLMSWFTILLEIVLPFSLINRNSAIICACLAVSFHFGIAAFLGLWSFAWVFVAYAIAFADLGIFLHRAP